MVNKGRIICLLVALSVFAATFAFGSPVKVAVIESLSGPQASTGLLYRTATRWGVDRINAAGGWNGQKVEFLEYDNQGGTGVIPLRGLIPGIAAGNVRGFAGVVGPEMNTIRPVFLQESPRLDVT